jgi:hypothetical protein
MDGPTTPTRPRARTYFSMRSSCSFLTLGRARQLGDGALSESPHQAVRAAQPVTPRRRIGGMTDEGWYKPHRPPAPLCPPRVGELLFEFHVACQWSEQESVTPLAGKEVTQEIVSLRLGRRASLPPIAPRARDRRIVAQSEDRLPSPQSVLRCPTCRG